MTHKPTNDQRKTVEALAGYGVPEINIASVVGIDPKTLRKHYRRELDTAFINANARVAQSLFKMATEGQNVAAAIFWMKVRAGWTEKQSIEVTTNAERPVTEYTDAELVQLIGSRREGSDGTVNPTESPAKPH